MLRRIWDFNLNWGRGLGDGAVLSQYVVKFRDLVLQIEDHILLGMDDFVALNYVRLLPI